MSAVQDCKPTVIQSDIVAVIVRSVPAVLDCKPTVIQSDIVAVIVRSVPAVQHCQHMCHVIQMDIVAVIAESLPAQPASGVCQSAHLPACPPGCPQGRQAITTHRGDKGCRAAAVGLCSVVTSFVGCRRGGFVSRPKQGRRGRESLWPSWNAGVEGNAEGRESCTNTDLAS